MNDLPTLKTKRITLDRFVDADVPRLAELCGDWKIAETTLHLPYPYTEAVGRQWIASHAESIQSGAGYPFAIRLTATGELLGCVGVHPNAQHRRAEIGYWMGVPYWGNGYCTEAGIEAIRFAFEDLNLNAVTCGYFVGNHASQRVMEKLGIIFEGIRRQHFYRHEEYIDLAVGTLLRSEWESRQ